MDPIHHLAVGKITNCSYTTLLLTRWHVVVVVAGMGYETASPSDASARPPPAGEKNPKGTGR